MHDVHLLVEFSECRVGKLRIDPQSRAKLQNDVQMFQMFFVFFHVFFGQSSTCQVLHEKRFLGFGVHQVCATGPRRRPPKARRRGMGCMGIGCTPVVPVALRIFGGKWW